MSDPKFPHRSIESKSARIPVKTRGFWRTASVQIIELPLPLLNNAFCNVEESQLLGGCVDLDTLLRVETLAAQHRLDAGRLERDRGVLAAFLADDGEIHPPHRFSLLAAGGAPLGLVLETLVEIEFLLARGKNEVIAAFGTFESFVCEFHITLLDSISTIK